MSFDGATEVLHQQFAYSTAWDANQNFHWDSKHTTVTTTDLVASTTAQTTYTYSPILSPTPPNATPNAWTTKEIPLEQVIQYKDGGGAVLRTATKSWLSPRALQSVQTTLENNQASLVIYCYNSNEEQTEKDEYDFGTATITAPSCAPNLPSSQAGTLLRKTTTSYASFAQHIVDRPSAAITYTGSGTRIAETDFPSYDTNGNLLTQTAQCFTFTSQSCPQGNSTTTYTYDSQGQKLTSVDARSNSTTYSYTDSYSSCGGAAPPSSPSDAYLTQITSPQTNGVNHIVKYCYDYTKGIPLSSTDENNRTTTYSYADSLNRVTTASYPDGGQTTTAYSDAGPSPNVTTTRLVTSGVSVTNLVVSDAMGHVVQTQLPTDPDGTTYTPASYDGLGRPSKTFNPTRCSPPTSNCGESTWGVTTNFYDALGRVCLVAPPDGTLPSGNPCAAQPSNDVLTTYSGNTVTVTDQAGHSRKSVTDALGRLTQVFEDPAGLNYETDYAYDALDNLLSVTQKGGSPNSTQWRVRTFAYDSLSRLLSATNPESGTIAYAYDANGNLNAKTSPAPNQAGSSTVTLSYCYDALNRLTSKAYIAQSCPMSSPVATYSYDQTSFNGLTITNGIGRRTSMTDQAGSEAWAYDSMGRVLTDLRTTLVPGASNSVSKNMVYTYNLDGSIATLTMPTDSQPRHSTLTYQQGGAGRPLSVQSGTNFATNVHYTPWGTLCYWQGGWDGLFTTTSSFNKRLQPATIYSIQQQGTSPTPPAVCAATPIIPNDTVTANMMYLTYSYNDSNGHNNGNVASMVNNLDGDSSQSFTYDALNRIATAQTSGTNQPDFPFDTGYLQECWAEQYSYDPWGNLLSISPSSSSSYIGCSQESGFNFTGAIGANNRIVASGYQYDSAGNLTAAPPTGTTYTFDAENHLISTAGVNYTYDGDGKRVTKSNGTIYWYGMNSEPLIESDFSLNLKYSYIFFGGRRIARSSGINQVSFFLTDHLGNTRAMHTQTGNIVSDFYPFGAERIIQTGTSTNYKFTGKERDPESGLDNFGARYDSSSMGRFMSPDPIYIARHRQADPQLLNLYQYGRSNPLRFTDSTGLDVKLDCSEVTSKQCTQIVEDVNGRKGKEFDVTRNEKTGLLEAKVNDPSNLSPSEGALYNAINDTNHHATLGVVSESDQIHFGRFDGNGHNTLDASDLTLLSNVSRSAAGEVVAHEALEAFSSSSPNTPYELAHWYANQFFGQITNPFVAHCEACTPAWNRRDWRFGRIGETFNVKTIETPVPDAARLAYEPGKIVEIKKAREQ